MADIEPGSEPLKVQDAPAARDFNKFPRTLKEMVMDFLSDTGNALKMMSVTHRDFWFFVICMLIAYGLFYPDTSNMLIVKVVAGFIIGVAMISHIGRRLMFPYINLSDYSKAALEDKNLPAAIVFASVCAVIVSIIVVSGAFFSH